MPVSSKASRQSMKLIKPASAGIALVLDIGNTSASAALADIGRGRLLRKIRVPSTAPRSGIRDALSSLLKGCGYPPSHAVLAAVVPADGWRRELRRVLGFQSLEVGAKLRMGFSLGGYPKPNTIGPDRLADAAAAVWRFGAPVITVNCGTATVLNVIDGKGVFAGGMILPGAPLFLEYLSERTARLPRLCWRGASSGVPSVGRSTAQAMRAGAVFGFAGMVEAAIRQARLALGEKKTSVCVTGGYSGRLAGQLPFHVFVDRDLTLLGLCRILSLNTNI